MKKAIRLLSLVLAVVFLCTACSGKPDGTGETYALGDICRGGEGGQDLNVKAVTVQKSGEETAVTLQFCSGSETMSGGETAVDALPVYTVRMLDRPYRLEVQLKGISYWDYGNVKGLPDNALISGAFRQIPVNTEYTVLYFQLNSKASFRAEENGSELTLYLSPENSSEQPSYHVYVNAFYDYQEGVIPADLNLTPTLCEDLTNVTLLSKPYDAENDALAELEEVQTWLDEHLPGEVASVIALKAGSLPVYDQSVDQVQLESTPVALIDGLGVSFPVAVKDLRLLDMTADGRKLAARPMDALESGEVYEQLWVEDAGGNMKPFLEYEFYSVAQAAFSPDEKRVAFTELTSQYKLFYVADIETGELIPLSEAGLGNDIASFVWGENSDTLYCLTWEDCWSVYKVDLTKTGEDMFSRVCDTEAAEGNMAYVDGYVYFTGFDAAAQDVIYRADARGNVEAFHNGSNFVLSPDNSRMAVVTQVYEDMAIQSKLEIVNVSDGTSQVIIGAAQIQDVLWDLDGTLLYYGISRWEEDTLYPYALHMYNVDTGEDVYAADIVSYNRIMADINEGELLIEVSYTMNDQIKPVVYRFTVEK